MSSYPTVKNHCVAFLGEFVGTFLFLFFAFAATQIANDAVSPETGPNLQQLFYISLIFGCSLAINVWVFFRVSGGLFNPVVTLALCITGVVPVLRSIFIFVAQIVAGIAAAGLTKALIPNNGINFNVSLKAGTSIVQGLFLEMFLTAELVFTILMLAAERTKATFIAPLGIGLALFVAELVGVYLTGGALNPTRALGPAVIMRSFNGYHWIYWVGPVLGALLASGFYALLKYFNYEDVNGDQDKSPDDEKIADAGDDQSPNKRREQDASEGGSGRGGSHRSSYSNQRDMVYANGNRHRGYSGRPGEAPRPPPKERYDHDQLRTSYDRQSRGSITGPDPSRTNEETAFRAGAPPIIGRDGREYIQDAEAQNRVRRSNERMIRDEERGSRSYQRGNKERGLA